MAPRNMFDDEPPPAAPRPSRPGVTYTPARRDITPPRANMFDNEPGVPGVPQPRASFDSFSKEQFNRPFGEIREIKPSDRTPTENFRSVLQSGFRAAGADPYTAGHLGGGYTSIGQLTPFGGVLSGADFAYHAPKAVSGDKKLQNFGHAALDAVGMTPANVLRSFIPAGRLGARETKMIRTAETPVLETADYARRAAEGGPAAQRRAAEEARMPNTMQPSGSFRPFDRNAPALPLELPQGLKDSSQAAYRFSERSPLEYHPNAMADYVGRARAYLESPYHGQGVFSPEKAAEAFSTLERFERNFPRGGNRPITATDFDTLRQQLKDLPGASGAAGQQAVNVLDTYMMRPPQGMLTRGTPQDIADLQQSFYQGRGDWRAFKTAEGVDDAANKYAEIKAGRANSGMNAGNSVRQELSKFVASPGGENRLYGATEDERRNIIGAVMGDRTTNMERSASNVLGGGGGLQRGLSGAGGAGVGAYLASHFGLDPWMALAASSAGAVAAPTAGALLRGSANARTTRAANEVVGDIARNSPLYRAREAVSPPVADPRQFYRDAVTTALIPSIRDEGADVWDRSFVPNANRE